jgi:hypothetical protein
MERIERFAGIEKISRRPKAVLDRLRDRSILARLLNPR